MASAKRHEKAQAGKPGLDPADGAEQREAEIADSLCLGRPMIKHGARVDVMDLSVLGLALRPFDLAGATASD